MKQNKQSHFWASYADLMTSLFFIMVVLFIITIIELNKIDLTPEEAFAVKYENDSLNSANQKLIQKCDSLAKLNINLNISQNKYIESLDSMTFLANATQAQIDKINEINNATQNLNANFFEYDKANKKHKLKFDVKFKRNDDNIYKISSSEREKLLTVGRELQRFINNAYIYTPEVQYLLIIEGQASKDGYDKMDYNYDLSYRRAKNLKKFWDNKGIVFKSNNCEVLISGSGDGRLSGTGRMRELNEVANQRFLIHILPKPGQIE